MVFSKSFWAKFSTVFVLLLTISFLTTQICPFKLFKKRVFKKCIFKKSLFRSSSDNFYEIEKNIFYRSKQLQPRRLKFFIKKFKIKTIINLRGENQNKSWWKKEKKVAKKFGVKLYNIPMSAKRLPHKKDLIYLLDLYQNAPRPILIHCQGGADRTGEAAALWVLDQQHKRKKDALKQLTLKYGHIKFRTPSKRFFIKMWKNREWALNQYNPEDHPRFYKL